MSTGIMLKGMTRLVSRVHKLDPGRFLHLGTQAPQCLVAHLNNQVPNESPRAISRTLENDPAKHGEQHVGRHYSISVQELKTVFPHGLPPRFAMQGIMRVRNATDAVGIVLKELKRQSSQGIFRLLVAVDGVNALWGRTTLKREDKSLIAPEELALIYNLRKMVKNDWQGGAIVLTVSQTGSLFKPRKAYLPQELLGKEGFDTLDPFIPILVSNYNPKEFEGCIQYYLENNWLQHEKAHTEEGKKELLFLSNRNPGLLERLCAYL